MATYSRPSFDSSNGDHNPFFVPSSNGNSHTKLRTQLQSILDSKEREVQVVGSFGQQILAQRMELEERLNALFELEYRNNGARTPPSPGGIGQDPEMRRMLEDLEQLMQGWQSQNDQTLENFGQKVRPFLTRFS